MSYMMRDMKATKVRREIDWGLVKLAVFGGMLVALLMVLVIMACVGVRGAAVTLGCLAAMCGLALLMGKFLGWQDRSAGGTQ